MLLTPPPKNKHNHMLKRVYQNAHTSHETPYPAKQPTPKRVYTLQEKIEGDESMLSFTIEVEQSFPAFRRALGGERRELKIFHYYVCDGAFTGDASARSVPKGLVRSSSSGVLSISASARKRE